VNHGHHAIGLAAFVALSCACSKAPEPSSSTPSTTSTPPPVASPTSSGTVVGKAPAPGTSGAVVVVLEPRTPRTFPPQTEPPVMDQAGLTFGPDLLLVRTGQPVQFRNSDDTLHNVHVSHEETREPSFNVAIPTGESYTYTFKRDGFYRVGCDIHPAMAAVIFSASTPFSTLAEDDGSFTFADVPPGSWTVTVYAAGRRLQRDVEVQAGVIEVKVE
jgi:plastocyanin